MGGHVLLAPVESGWLATRREACGVAWWGGVPHLALCGLIWLQRAAREIVAWIRGARVGTLRACAHVQIDVCAGVERQPTQRRHDWLVMAAALKDAVALQGRVDYLLVQRRVRTV